MATAAALSLFGLFFLAVGVAFLRYPGSMPDSGMVSPNAITSDPEAAAAEARRWNQIRGFVIAGVGAAFLGAGVAVLL
jgi:hypothetical protein